MAGAARKELISPTQEFLIAAFQRIHPNYKMEIVSAISFPACDNILLLIYPGRNEQGDALGIGIGHEIIQRVAVYF